MFPILRPRRLLSSTIFSFLMDSLTSFRAFVTLAIYVTSSESLCSCPTGPARQHTTGSTLAGRCGLTEKNSFEKSEDVTAGSMEIMALTWRSSWWFIGTSERCVARRNASITLTRPANVSTADLTDSNVANTVDTHCYMGYIPSTANKHPKRAHTTRTGGRLRFLRVHRLLRHVVDDYALSLCDFDAIGHLDKHCVGLLAGMSVHFALEPAKQRVTRCQHASRQPRAARTLSSTGQRQARGSSTQTHSR